jgi:hypothetical protein
MTGRAELGIHIVIPGEPYGHIIEAMAGSHKQPQNHVQNTGYPVTQLGVAQFAFLTEG